ncbi:MAG: 4Fe-4S binding protein [Infirmifilum sp.]
MRTYLKAVLLGVKEAFKERLTEPIATVTDNGYSRGVPRLDRSKCLGCGLCARSCPPNAIKMEPAGKRVVGGREVTKQEPRFDYFRCIYCGQCADVCPAKAITLERKSPLDAIKTASPSFFILALPCQITDFLIILLVVALVYWLAGRFSARGRHEAFASEPFSGGVPLNTSSHRYHALNLMAFVIFLVLIESLSFLYLFGGGSPKIIVVLLLTALVIYLQGILLIRGWAR